MTLHPQAPSEETNGVWVGGLEDEQEFGVVVFYDNGTIQIGASEPTRCALRTITPQAAIFLAGLLVKAAQDAQTLNKEKENQP